MKLAEGKEKSSWPLFRIVVPAFPRKNIFSRVAKKTTALGPVMAATAADKVWGQRVELIDENNYRGPRDSRGLPDHKALQEEDSASVVGFYCGLTSTMERVWELADFYRQTGAKIIAGGWHAHYCPEETLSHNVDIVVHGDGEIVIQTILRTIKEESPLSQIPGISFMKEGRIATNPPAMLEVSDLNDLPFPDYGLIRHSGRIDIYPVGRIRGCRMRCEFCSVKGKPRWASSEHFFRMIKFLVQTRNARRFFIVDDRSEEDIAGTIEFFRMISAEYGNRLDFTVQMRLEAARSPELLTAMKEAGVRTACIGYESPADEALKAMRKGLRSSEMLEMTRIWQKFLDIHMMIIVNYPLLEESRIGAKEMEKLFQDFIRQHKPRTVQALLPVPLVGTDLRARLAKEGKIFPLELVPWSRYDGNYPCFAPDNMSLREFQQIPINLMKRFYDPFSFARVVLRILVFPVDYLARGWRQWHRGWYGDLVKYAGHRLIRQWQKKQEVERFLEKLEQHRFGQKHS